MTNKNISPIGGFFELERFFKNSMYHDKSIALTSGRACISLILKLEHPKRIYIPYYTCNAVIDPIETLGIEYIFYEIDKDLEPKRIPNLNNDDLFLYINYFGLKGEYCNKIITNLGKKVVIDNTHNFFHKGWSGIYSFTSARKYFGIPDGAFLYGIPKNYAEKILRNNNVSILPNIAKLEGRINSYNLYKESESLFDSEVKRISYISEIILSNIDYEQVAKKRVDNYNYLHDNLGSINTFFTQPLHKDDTPFCYPFVPKKYIEKKMLHKLGLFIPSFWLDVSSRAISGFKFEKHLSTNMLPLPVDHRYSKNEMKTIVRVVNSL